MTRFVAMLNSPAGMSWASDAVYVVILLLALYTLMLLVCFAVAAERDPFAHATYTHPAKSHHSLVLSLLRISDHKHGMLSFRK
jgi:hypothetical protein